MHYEFNNNINEKVLIKANNILGFDISNYKIIINGESIHHIDKRHGKNGKHDQSMRNDLDLSRAQYIFTNADYVAQAINSSGQKAIDTQYRDKNNEPSKILLFAKKINGTYCIALASPCSNKETLHVKSMYFSKKIEDIQEFDTNSPEPTPKANLEISSKNIIVNEFLDVNKKQEKFTGINNSHDTKKAAENGGEVKYCSRDNNPNSFNPEGATLKQQLNDAYYTSKSFDQRYVYVGRFSQDFINLLEKNKIILHNYPIAMNYRDAYLSMHSKETGKYHGTGINYHNLGITGLREALESFKNPKHIIKSKKNGKIELI